jgi:hypothetical protein
MVNAFSEFLSIAKILSIHSQIFGLMPLSFNKANFIISTPKLFYTIVLLVLNLGLGGYSTVVVPQFSDVFSTTMTMVIVGQMIFISCTLLCSILTSNKRTELLNNLIEFDVTLQENCMVINYQKDRRKMLLRLLGIYTFLIVYFVWHENLSLWKDFPVDRFFRLYGLAMHAFNNAVFYLVTELVLILKIRFATLNKQLNHLVKYFSLRRCTNTLHRRVIVRQKFLRFTKICTLHHLLSKSVRLFNDVFGLTLLMMFGANFVEIVITFFYVTIQLQANEVNWKHSWFTVLSAVNFIIYSIVVCDVCYSTVEEVT